MTWLHALPSHQQPWCLTAEKWKKMQIHSIDGLVQDCSISIANALEILQYATKPSIYPKFDSARLGVTYPIIITVKYLI